jgi:hypothetical protein
MPTWYDLASLGVTRRWDPKSQAVRWFAPADRPDLRAVVLAEVDRRRSIVPLNLAMPYGRCYICGDEMPNYRAGSCMLCSVARRNK